MACHFNLLEISVWNLGLLRMLRGTLVQNISAYVYCKQNSIPRQYWLVYMPSRHVTVKLDEQGLQQTQ